MPSAASDGDAAKIPAEVAETENALRSIQTRIAQLSHKIEDAQEAQLQADALAARRSVLQKELQQTIVQRDRLDRTIQLLQKAQEEMTGQYLSGMQTSFLHYFRCFLPEEAEVGFDEMMQPQLTRAGFRRPMEQFSSGIQSVADFCMRLALIDLLFGRERPFLILDDPFVYLDNVHLHQAQKLLNEVAQNTQILYLTCHSSRADAVCP